MRRLLFLGAFLTVFSALALAESWTGRLVDATCYDQQKSATACDPTSSTSMFALIVSNHAYKFDEDGNTKAAEALKSRADRSANPDNPGMASSKMVAARVSGTKDGDSIKVDTITVQ
jgi:hypothetical protein